MNVPSMALGTAILLLLAASASQQLLSTQHHMTAECMKRVDLKKKNYPLEQPAVSGLAVPLLSYCCSYCCGEPCTRQLLELIKQARDRHMRKVCLTDLLARA